MENRHFPRPGILQGAFVGGSPRRPGPGVVQRHSRGGIRPAEGPLPEGWLRPTGTGPGQSLPGAVRSRMEALFRTDFSGVRIHVEPQAIAIGALAFTVGPNIHFAPGRYDPVSPQGLRLLGHELAHVVQQREGRVRHPSGQGLAIVHNFALEAEAERWSLRAATVLQAAGRAGARTAAPHPAPLHGAVEPRILPVPPIPRPHLAVIQRATTTHGSVTFDSHWDPDTQITNDISNDQGPGFALIVGRLYIQGARVVIRGAVPDIDGWRIGYLQTVAGSSRHMMYMDETSRRDATISQPGPARDGDGQHGFWMIAPSPKSDHKTAGDYLRNGITLHLGPLTDLAPLEAPWTDKDGRQIVEISGEDGYVTWLAAHHEDRDELVLLERFDWRIDWSVYRSTGKTFKRRDSAGFYEGAGRYTVDRPVLGGSLANTTWQLQGKEPVPLSFTRTPPELQIKTYPGFNQYGSNFP
ncbi:MAG TPA: DUF4157 domain-containing protein [Thermoanaerobaculia bacterium]